MVLRKKQASPATVTTNKVAIWNKKASLTRNPSGKRYFIPENIERAKKAGWVEIPNKDKKYEGMVLMQLK